MLRREQMQLLAEQIADEIYQEHYDKPGCDQVTEEMVLEIVDLTLAALIRRINKLLGD